MIDLTKAVTAAIHDSAVPLTRSLRRTASRAGWAGHAGRSLRVVPEGKNLIVESNDAGMDHEFGGTGAPPKATIRKWANHDAEDVLIKSIAKRLRGVV